MKLLQRLGRPTASAVRSFEQQTRANLQCHQLRHARLFHHSLRRQEAKKQNEDSLSFRGQLYESTSDRLARERATESRYVSQAQAKGQSTSSRSLALSFGKSWLCSKPLSRSNASSNPLRGGCRILGGNECPSTSADHI